MQFAIRRRTSKPMNLTAMIDIIFQLVIFFMVTTSFVDLEAIDVSITSNAVLADEQVVASQFAGNNKILVAVTADKLLVNEQELAISDFEKRLKDRFQKDSKTPVNIMSTDGVTVQRLVSVIDMVRASGGSNVTINHD